MFKLDNDFLTTMGLGGLPVEEKNRLLQMIYERLEMNVGMRLAEKMTDQQLDEFEGFIDRNDEAGALKWLETNFPNYKDVVAEELEKLKGEVQSASPQILAASQVTNMQNSNNPMAQPSTAPMMPPMGQAPGTPGTMPPQQPAPQPMAQPSFGQPSDPYAQTAPLQPAASAYTPPMPNTPPAQQFSQPMNPGQPAPAPQPQPSFNPAPAPMAPPAPAFQPQPAAAAPQYQPPVPQPAAPTLQPYQPLSPQQPDLQQYQPQQPPAGQPPVGPAPQQQFTPPPPGFTPSS